MIAEHLVRKRFSGDKNGLRDLVKYVIQSKGQGAATDWKIGDYVIDAEHSGAKVGTVRVTNCEEVSPGHAIIEMLALSQMNTRSKADRAFHLVISFPTGENPTPEQLIDIEDELVASIGFQDHKRISATHVNTDNLHIHVAICTVHPETFKLPTPYRSHYKLQEACIALEERHGLIETNHNRGGVAPASDREKAGFGLWIEVHAAESIKAAAVAAQSWDELHREMARHGLVIKPRGAGLVVAHYKDGRSMVKASTIDRSLAIFPLVQRFGPYQAPAALGITPVHQYTAGGRQPEAESLWTRYQAERAAALGARQGALLELKHRHVVYADALRHWYEERYRAAREQRLSRVVRRSTLHTLAVEAKQDRAERIGLERADRDKVRMANPVLNWHGFLAREAAAGNQVAALTLQRTLGRTTVSHEHVRDQISVIFERTEMPTIEPGREGGRL